MSVLSLKIRLPSELKAWLEMRSAQNVRSINSEVVHLLYTAMLAAETSSNLPIDTPNRFTTVVEG